MTVRPIVPVLMAATLTVVASSCSLFQQEVKQDHDAMTMDDTSTTSLSIASPKEGEVVAGPDVAVAFDLRHYTVASGSQHIHLILDNEPYMPVYDTAKPFVLKGVKPGSHTLRAFPSRAWHESIKTSQAFAFVNFSVGAPDNAHVIDPQAPLLTYSRPKGTYEGKAADSILLDFWLRNATLGPDSYKVRYTVDDWSTTLTEWKPVKLTGLQEGTHSIKLELLDPAGNNVPGEYNTTERVITVKH